jgi:hypothetical protein
VLKGRRYQPSGRRFQLSGRCFQVSPAEITGKSPDGVDSVDRFLPQFLPQSFGSFGVPGDKIVQKLQILNKVKARFSAQIRDTASLYTPGRCYG